MKFSFISDLSNDRFLASVLLVHIVSELLSDARSQPFAISPQVMQRSVQHLHRLDTSLVSLDRELFSAFLTNVRPAMLECDLEAQIEADRRLQAQLRESGFATGESKSRKRIFDADH